MSARRRITLFTSKDCHLCEKALEALHDVQRDIELDLEVIDIGGNPELETRYRSRLPVLEIDGQPAFTYFVDPVALRERLG